MLKKQNFPHIYLFIWPQIQFNSLDANVHPTISAPEIPSFSIYLKAKNIYIFFISWNKFRHQGVIKKKKNQKEAPYSAWPATGTVCTIIT